MVLSAASVMQDRVSFLSRLIGRQRAAMLADGEPPLGSAHPVFYRVDTPAVRRLPPLWIDPEAEALEIRVPYAAFAAGRDRLGLNRPLNDLWVRHSLISHPLPPSPYHPATTN